MEVIKPEQSLYLIQNWKQKFWQARVLLRLFRNINVLVAWTYNEKLVPKIAIKKLDIKKGD